MASFWDIESSGKTISDGGTGKTTAEMQTMSTFTDAGWDFTTPVWTIDEGVDYPRLWWELVPVLHAEPELILGTSNTISWDPVLGANDCYAECAEDANFTSIIYNSGWITETSYEFTGLELDQQYKGRYEEALNKLQNDILQKTDGCAETGEPDKNDWIITCEEQGELYLLVIETIEHVKGLMNQ